MRAVPSAVARLAVGLVAAAPVTPVTLVPSPAYPGNGNRNQIVTIWS